MGCRLYTQEIQTSALHHLSSSSVGSGKLLFAFNCLFWKILIDSSGIALRYLKSVNDTSLIKSQDVFTVLRYISYNTYGKTMAWDWIRLNWQYLVDR